MKGPIALLMAENPPTCRYAEEVFAHAGLFASRVDIENLPAELADPRILVIAGHVALDESQREAVSTFVSQGGILIAVGGTSGLESLLGIENVESPFAAGFGVETQCGLGEGYIQRRRRRHPIISGLASSLHTFGGVAVQASSGRSLARMRDAQHRPTGQDALVEHKVGKGLALFIAPDLFGSIVRIQQGICIDQDGLPAGDGSAPLNDGILKCEDGMVLNFQWDRTQVDEQNLIFYHPIADELREILVRSVLYGAQQKRLPLAMLWYYPRNLPALGHISHDSDINDPALAESMLNVVDELGIHTTWCIIEPGYPEEFYARLRRANQEIALHYDALDGRPRTCWAENAFRGQHDWLSRAAGVKLISNKNHYTRWEGRLDFFRWCVEAGIQCDQSKGPSKRGTIGYPFGGCHPWFPIDNAGRIIDCLELNLQTQDLVVTSPEYFGAYWVDQAARYHGVAHLLFHPAHIEKPGVADALRSVVRYGRERGLEWWTCAQINDWERARRGVTMASLKAQRREWIAQFRAEEPLRDATLLLLNAPGKGTRVERYGFEFQAVVRDIEAETEVRLT